MNAQLIFPLSLQLSPHQAQLKRMLEMHVYFCEVMQN